MNKKGFTLIELLATVFVLAIVLGLAIFSVTRLLSEKADEGFEDSKKGLKSGARIFMSANPDSCDIADDETIYVCVKSLKEQGYYNKITKSQGANGECDGYVSIHKNKAETNPENLFDIETYLKCGTNFVDVPDGKLFSNAIYQRCQTNTNNICLK